MEYESSAFSLYRRVIDTMIRGINGKVHFNWRSEGMECRIAFPGTSWPPTQQSMVLCPAMRAMLMLRGLEANTVNLLFVGPRQVVHTSTRLRKEASGRATFVSATFAIATSSAASLR